MTDYNDGKWHGWNGGECPVHPKSMVEFIWFEDGKRQKKESYSAAGVDWATRDDPVVAFRVTKAHREPREFWIITEGEDYIYTSLESAEADKQKGEEIIHVREVLE